MINVPGLIKPDLSIQISKKVSICEPIKTAKFNSRLQENALFDVLI